jgi:hypothetical protein
MPGDDDLHFRDGNPFWQDSEPKGSVIKAIPPAGPSSALLALYTLSPECGYMTDLYANGSAGEHTVTETDFPDSWVIMASRRARACQGFGLVDFPRDMWSGH